MTVPGYRRVCPVHTPAPEDGNDLCYPLLTGPGAQTEPGRSAIRSGPVRQVYTGPIYEAP
ncbi:hypothetical protein GCM10023074_02760 [Microbispora amethystogenes]|uniref:Uncharacterized protein n=1 Tax=Microbispora amethystogenes TaxID=1427754 RepID=A0ABQ4F5B5_9ACTN|nr:hypothetical protein Mam01_01660 [Microbispora amethystogenes]